LGIGYFEGRYGKEAIQKGYGLGIDTAKKILDARDKVGRFNKLKEIETVEGVGIDKFIDLVNSFK
jgi:DNA uptake protein ComE-like DNA-binding protein